MLHFFSEAIFYSLNYKYQKSNVYNQSLKFRYHEPQTGRQRALPLLTEQGGRGRAARWAALGGWAAARMPAVPGHRADPEVRVIPEQQLGSDRIAQKTLPSEFTTLW